MVIARVGYHLTVLEGKLTAVDFEDFEVLELGKTWKKKSYRGAARPHFSFFYSAPFFPPHSFTRHHSSIGN